MTVTVVGIGADGWPGLGARARTVIEAAEVVVGGSRQLALLPDEVRAERRPLPSPLRPNLPGLLAELRDRDAVVLASGDPMLSGIGSTIIDLVGPVDVIPAVSSVTLARAEMGWSAESCTTVSVVGRDVHLVLRQLAPGVRLLVLVSDGSTAAQLATLLDSAGYGDSTLTVLSDLGSSAQARVEYVASAFAGTTPSLSIVAIECRGDHRLGWVAGLPDAAFEHDGQITKRDARASALARLAPRPGELLWDVGAGAGSVAIEWSRAHPSCRSVAIERDPTRAARIASNANRLGVPGVIVVEGSAPAALDHLERPQAIFVGGGATAHDLLDVCWNSLPAGGRLVVHGVTVETESLLGALHRERGGELIRLHVERAEPLGGFTGWTPARPIVQWAVVKRGGDGS